MKEVHKDGTLIGITWDDISCNIPYHEDYWDTILAVSIFFFITQLQYYKWTFIHWLFNFLSLEIPEFQRNKVWHVDYNIWDNRARGHLARSLIDPPQPNKEEILLMNKKPCPSLKPFHQLDFIGNETDCKEDDEVTTAIEIDTMKEKMPAAPSCSKKFSRKTSVQVLLMWRKSSSSFFD